MKHNAIKCDDYKPVTKTGLKEKCNCKYLNRNEAREYKLYKQFVRELDKKKTR